MTSPRSSRSRTLGDPRSGLGARSGTAPPAPAPRTRFLAVVEDLGDTVLADEDVGHRTSQHDHADRDPRKFVENAAGLLQLGPASVRHWCERWRGPSTESTASTTSGCRRAATWATAAHETESPLLTADHVDGPFVVRGAGQGDRHLRRHRFSDTGGAKSRSYAARSLHPKVRVHHGRRKLRSSASTAIAALLKIIERGPFVVTNQTLCRSKSFGSSYQ